MFLFNVRFHAIDDCGSPFDNEGFQAVFLVQVGVHELLESLLGRFGFLTFFVEFHFLSVHVRNSVLKLLEGKYAVLGATYWCITSSSGTSCR